MFYSYISYWNTLQYKCTVHYYFSCLKRISARVTSEDICLFLYCLDFILFHEALLLRCLTDLVDAQPLCLGFTSFNFPLCLLKCPLNYYCRLCTILCMIFKRLLFMQALCRPLFTKYAHCKPLLPFQSNALWIMPAFRFSI